MIGWDAIPGTMKSIPVLEVIHPCTVRYMDVEPKIGGVYPQNGW